MRIERLNPRFGGIIYGVDLRSLSASELSEIKGAFDELKLLFFKNQNLDDDEQIAFASNLGTVTIGHPVSANGDSNVFNIDSAAPGFSASDVWHADMTYLQEPPLGSLIRAVILPDSGGDTSWADTQLAFEGLSPSIQRFIDGLTAWHDGREEWGEYLRERGHGNEWNGRILTELPPVQHPLVRRHPITGRAGLFVNPAYCTRIEGLSQMESDYLFRMMYEQLTRPENIVRHRWSEGDVGLWDNRATLHYANGDYEQRRVMRRVTIAGDVPA